MSEEQTTDLPTARTPYGFSWGDATISRAAEHKGHRMVMIETAKQRLMVRITPSGLIRVEPVEAKSGEKLSVAI